MDNRGNESDLQQFTSFGHILCFSCDSLTIASKDHMLKAEFIGSRAVAPEADAGTSTENNVGKASPLNRVTYHNVWDGVTLVYKGSPGAIFKSTYYIDATATRVTVERIRLSYNRPLSLDKHGNLVISYENGIMVENAPLAWQEINGLRQHVDVEYKLFSEHEVGFSLGDYLPGIPVVIDPTLSWNTFLGGSASSWGQSIAVDVSGNVYVAGESNSTWGSPIRAYTSDLCAFAAKLDSSGNLIWNTFLGTSGDYLSCGIAVDRDGNVYVDGNSSATWGSPVRAYTSGHNVFAAKLDANGNLIWNTFLGASGGDNCWSDGISVDGSGNVYVAGNSIATWGNPVQAYTAGNDAFAAKLSDNGSLMWNTFMGGSGDDFPCGIVVDGTGNVYVVGGSSATWGNPMQAYTASDGAFAARLDNNGNLAWNTFLGGGATGIAVDSKGNVYVAGSSNTTWGNPVQAGNGAYAAKLNSSGNLIWNTFLGSSPYNLWSSGIAVDGGGNAYVARVGRNNRSTSSIDDDTYVSKVNSVGTVNWSIELGGNAFMEDDDYSDGIAVDGVGNTYVTGYSSNAGWGNPVRPFTGGTDAFVAKIHDDWPVVTTLDANPVGTTATLNGTLVSDGGDACRYRFCYGTSTGIYTDNSTWSTDNKTSGQSFSANITGLIPGIVYYYVAECMNDNGTGTGSERGFTGAGAPAVTNASGATNITTTTAILNGNLISDGGKATTVIIYGGTTDGGTTIANWGRSDNLGVTVPGAFSLGIMGLSIGKTYYYRCAATNSAGTSWAPLSSSFVTQSTWAAFWEGPGKDWWRFSSGR